MNNIYDIAKLAGVSIATVSRVINGSDKVSSKTRNHVMEVIEEYGYKPNAFAQGLGLNTMHTIGIIVPVLSDLYMSNAVYFLEQALQERGYTCLLSCSGFSQEKKELHTSMLIDKHIDALIYVGSTYSGRDVSKSETDYIRDAATKVPVFIINGVVEGENIYSSVCDDSQAVFSAVSSLIKSGRKKILFLSESKSYSAKQKLSGYEEALNQAGIPVRGNLRVHLRNDSIHYVRDMLLERMDLDFDAAMCTTDSIACGVLKFAAARRLKVPDDISVIGYNNSVISLASEPELSSIDNHTEDICRGTVERIVRILNGIKDIVPVLSVPCTLHKRNSTDF